jgi:hypothetical protein
MEGEAEAAFRGDQTHGGSLNDTALSCQLYLRMMSALWVRVITNHRSKHFKKKHFNSLSGKPKKNTHQSYWKN